MGYKFTSTFFLLAIVVVILPLETYAFGAGDIPDFAYLNDRAFRHGDIESILETLVKSAGGAAVLSSSGFLGFASSVIKKAKGGSKFTKSDVQKVYFGNWLRDYSQAMDIAGLSKLSADTLVLVVAALGFMTFGFASEEFEVTADRLGVYLPVEHIDNPKGYAAKEGDARSFHPKLRPPVSPRELEIDDKTGMKKYIATENQGWDTSTAFIRRTFRACIQAGRGANGHEGAELWEAYRLLGQGLHTMEDLLAHSNWCEIALRKMGHRDIFCHVGDRVIVNTPRGPAPPLVTGTFGSADFLHSLLGEAGDKLSQASVTDLSEKMSNVSSGNGPDISGLKGIFSKFGGGNEKLNQGEEIKKKSEAYRFDPDNICPPEVQKQLLDLLKWHDDILRTIIKNIEMIPGLTNLLDEFSNALNQYIYTILALYLGPILTQATSVLSEGSKAVIDTDDQYEVFTNPNAHDPLHSMLSKDHFGLILNEPAGKIAQIVVENSVNLIVQAWSDEDNADRVIDQILEAFHHPYYATGRSVIQEKMFDHMQSWLRGLGSESQVVLQSLTKESVRAHKNKRPGLNENEEPGYGGCGHRYTPSKKPTGGNTSNTGSNQAHGRTGLSDNESHVISGGYAPQITSVASAYASSQGQSNSSSYDRIDSSDMYGQGRTNTSTGRHESHSQVDDDNRHSRQTYRHNDYPKYSQQREDIPSYGDQRDESTTPYDGQDTYSQDTYGGQDAYGGRRREQEDIHAYGGQATYRGQETEKIRAYSAQAPYSDQRREEALAYSGQPSYGQRYEETATYGAKPAYRTRQHHESSTYDGELPSEDIAHGDKQRYNETATPQDGGYGSSYRQPQLALGGDHRGDSSRVHVKKSRFDDNESDYEQHNKPSQFSYGKQAGEEERNYAPSEPAYVSDGGYGEVPDETSNYGRSNRDNAIVYNDNRKHHGKHGGRREDVDDQPHYKQPNHGDNEPSQYAPSYEGSYDTFGAERLNISRRGDQDDSDDDRRRHEGGDGRHHGEQRRYY